MSPQRFIKSYVAWWFYAMASVAHAAPQTHEPVAQNIQLGDSVMLPTRTIVGSHESTVAFFLKQKDMLPESVAFDSKDGRQSCRNPTCRLGDHDRRSRQSRSRLRLLLRVAR